jgi:hypothetical protein
MSKLAPSRPPPASDLSSLHLGLQVHVQTHSIMASQCIPKLDRSRHPSACPNWLDHGLPVHPQTRSITASKCISRLARLWPASSYNHNLQVYLQSRSITASKSASPTFDLTSSCRDFVDPRDCVDPHGRVVSYLLTFFLRSSSLM